MMGLEAAAEAIRKARHAIALTGAGISTDSSIPDYRGPNGVWTLDPGAERRAYEAYEVFKMDPVRYWMEGYGRHVLLDRFLDSIPNKGHLALYNLEREGHIKMTITQNIDDLHRKAGNANLIEFHGNATRLRCVGCSSRYGIGDKEVPRCPKCDSILKSDVVHFGEPIPGDTMRRSMEEVGRSDVMLICGTSAVVHPFASLPSIMKGNDPNNTVIEVNLSETQLTRDGVSDIFIKGNTSDILSGLYNYLHDVV
ncbi:MAG TPA: Sir2 family NAD-dependent protein deacetylase [Candidatus Methanofastidiosa archaeon]|nr:Sir2 family NAD-dependent protein deacetylase [Candidatus Methanofastidiosa archaeon]HPR42016.1 Sir2 family NAD-dependent protein deacetylase [Candidatus Methanofastidiosa archaeon]